MSKNWDNNYNGMWVPNGHGSLFRAMDEDKRIIAECNKDLQEMIRKVTYQAARKAIGELCIIKNNHLSLLNSKVLHKVSSQVEDPIIANLLNKSVTYPLSTPGVLGKSLWAEHVQKEPNSFVDYNKIYRYITAPFDVVNQDLSNAKSDTEVNYIKMTFLANLNHLNTYFEYSEGNNYLSPTSEIICKEPLIKVVEDIGLKIDNFNESQNELQRLRDEDNSSSNPPIVPPPVLNQSQQSQLVGNNPPMTELEKVLAEIKALKDTIAAKDLKIANMVSREEVEQIVEANKEEMDKVTKENAEKDGVIVEQGKTISKQNIDLEHSYQIKGMQAKEIYELRQDKIDLREQVKEHKDLTQEWKFIAKEKVEDLAIKNEKIAQLDKQLKQLHLPSLSEQSYEILETHNQENVVIPEILGDTNEIYS